jgi:hypothetical protein
MNAQNCQPSGATISDFRANQYCRLEIGFVFALALEPRETEVELCARMRTKVMNAEVIDVTF